MNKQDDYPAGAPCWVDTWQPDPRAALRFYGPLFGWTFDEPGSMGVGLGGDYFAARLGGRLVSGIGQAPASSPAVWSTYLRVDDVEQVLALAEAAGGTALAGPMDAGSDGRLAVLADSSDVPFCLWQAGRHIGAELVNEPNTWGMSSLHTTDLERARAFYGAVFGWELQPAPDAPLWQWRLAGQVVAVVTTTDGVTRKADFYDPTGEKARAVKAHYLGVCRGCGAYTQPRNGKGDAYAYCKHCHPGAIERRWTRERVVAAIAEWRSRCGWLPSSYDWSRTHQRRRGGEALERLARGDWPAASVVTRLFGTWSARVDSEHSPGGCRRVVGAAERGRWRTLSAASARRP